MSMDQRRRRREGSRRAQAARARRDAARQQRRKRSIFLAIGGTIVVAVVIALIAIAQGGGPDVGIRVSLPPGQPVHGPPFIYNTDITIDGVQARIPPTGGNHFGRPSSYGFIGENLVPEAVVHNMEHGASVIWYQSGDPELAGQVNQLVRALGNQCLVAGSFDDMSFEVAVTAWGRVLPLQQFDESQIREFVEAYRGDTGPEAGLCRQES